MNASSGHLRVHDPREKNESMDARYNLLQRRNGPDAAPEGQNRPEEMRQTMNEATDMAMANDDAPRPSRGLATVTDE